jgi:DNA-binding response OmpR family regulator
MPDQGRERGDPAEVLVSAPLLLIADDDADMRALVRRTLERDYPEALELADGRELFWHLLRASFVAARTPARDLVIVADIRMPAYSGLEVLDAWQDEARGVPCVVITSFPDDDVRARVTELGATLVPKPFTRGVLRDAVRAAARRSPRPREV